MTDKVIDNKAEKPPEVKMVLCSLESDIKSLLSGLPVYLTNDPLVQLVSGNTNTRLDFLNYKKKLAFENLPTRLLDFRLLDNKFTCKYGYTPLIPYMTFIKHIKGKTHVLIYKRSKTSDEIRLHDLYSIGVSGHVEFNMPGNLSITLVKNIKTVTKEWLGVDIQNYDIHGSLLNSMFIFDYKNAKNHC